MSDALIKYLRETVEQTPLSVAQYMKVALSHPKHGYYSTQPAIGADGDFITAPEISQLFGEMLASLLTHIWQLSGAPEAVLFEAGPGRGTLLADMDRTYQKLAPDLAAQDWILLEASALMQDQQKAALSHRKSTHIQNLSELPQRPLFGVANEFFDALGVNQAVFKDGKWHHRNIIWEGDGFTFHTGAALTRAEIDQISAPQIAADNDVIEHSPDAESIMQELAAHIARFGGALLICDYGKYGNTGDTLQAVQNHKPVPFFSALGRCDLTHWVDFAALAKIADMAGARLIGPQPQGICLRQLGIEARAEQLRKTEDPVTNRSLFASLERLLSPSQMGQVFKIALLVPQGEGTPPGFFPEEAN